MPITYDYIAESKQVRAIASGIISVTDILTYLNEVLTDPRIAEGFVEVVNFEAIEDLVLRYAELAPFKQVWSEYQKKGCAAVILYAPTDLSFGSLRMVQAVIQLSDENVADHFVVVRTKEELQSELLKHP